MDRRELINDTEDTLRLFMESQQSQIWTALPGIVTGADLDRQTVSVQPAIQGKVKSQTGKEQHVNMPLLVDVPIVWPRAGGFACTLPVQVGDEVLVVFASRCIDSWWQSGGIGAQAEMRMHDLSDGFAIFAPTSQKKVLSDVQTDGIELRNEARDTYIKLTNGKIFIKGDIEHDGSTKQTGNLERLGTSTTAGLITGAGGLAISGTNPSGDTATVSGGQLRISGSLVHEQGTIESLGKKIDGSHTHNYNGGVTGGANA